MTRTTAAAPVAEICLYGTSRTGAGWLVALPGGRMLGNGEPAADRSFTQAVWAALDAIRREGTAGPVRLFDAGGERCTTVHTSGCKWYGDLTWESAPVYVLRVPE